MSQDIRSYFSVLPSKKGSSTTKAKTSKALVISDEEDDKPTFKTTLGKRRESSHNEDASPRKKIKKSSKKSPEKLKPVNAASLFANVPIKQTPAKTEKAIEKASGKKNKEEKDRKEKFLETLKQLDEEELDVDFDQLDTSINETLKEEEEKSAMKQTNGRKRKASENLNESGLDPDEERHEKRRMNAMMYQRYLKRSSPPRRGAKEMPKGKPNCLKGLCFLKTGILDSLDSVSLNELVVQYGGRTVKAVSKKIHYLVVGDEPGPAKLEKAQSLGIPEISEDELLDMILEKSGLPRKYSVKEEEKVKPKSEKVGKQEAQSSTSKEPQKTSKISSPKQETPSKNSKSSKIGSSEKRKVDSPEKIKMKSSENMKINSSEKTKTKSSERKKIESPEKKVSEKLKTLSKPSKTNNSANNVKITTKQESVKPIDIKKVAKTEKEMCWTEKYKPTALSGIIGQQGASSNVNKLLTWLKDWNRTFTKGMKAPNMQNMYAKKPDGSNFRCALLSGPPGVGKTTTATMVAQELGFDVVEFNASDTRNKKLLHEEISQLLSSKSLSTYFKDGSAPTIKHVLLMDEVDGMSGNQDRGGIQELIALIKNSSVPIICMCNDRQHPKIRSLTNYCFDLRFIKPKAEQIRGAMMSICFKEGVKIGADDLLQIVVSTGNDVRQTLNHLSMWSASDKNLTKDMVEKESKSAKKDTILGPWEVVRKVFSQEEQKRMSLAEKSKLFFYDYSIGPLFVQENYLTVEPHCPKNQQLRNVALAADAISMGDVIESKIRSSNNWTLMESQAMYSTVLPGHYMAGHFTGMINFPSWLGKNSKRTKFQRLLSELQMHMRKSSSSGKQAINLDYIYLLRDKLTKPLTNEGTSGISQAVDVLTSYDLLREDVDSIIELSMWPNRKNPMNDIPPTLKAAFTRAYNKQAAALPYSMNTVSKKKGRAAEEENPYGDEEEEEVSEDEQDDDISKDAMIKNKKKAATKKTSSTESGKSKKEPKASTSGRGKGRKAK